MIGLVLYPLVAVALFVVVAIAFVVCVRKSNSDAVGTDTENPVLMGKKHIHKAAAKGTSIQLVRVPGGPCSTVPQNGPVISVLPASSSAVSSSIMSYSSSSLDEPPPMWTAYSPKNGVAWAPCRTHSYPDEDEDKKGFTFHGSFVSLMDSVSSLLSPPRPGRSNKVGFFGRFHSTSSLPGTTSGLTLSAHGLQVAQLKHSPRQPRKHQNRYPTGAVTNKSKQETETADDNRLGLNNNGFIQDFNQTTGDRDPTRISGSLDPGDRKNKLNEICRSPMRNLSPVNIKTSPGSDSTSGFSSCGSSPSDATGIKCNSDKLLKERPGGCGGAGLHGHHLNDHLPDDSLDSGYSQTGLSSNALNGPSGPFPTMGIQIKVSLRKHRNNQINASTDGATDSVRGPLVDKDKWEDISQDEPKVYDNSLIETGVLPQEAQRQAQGNECVQSDNTGLTPNGDIPSRGEKPSPTGILNKGAVDTPKSPKSVKFLDQERLYRTFSKESVSQESTVSMDWDHSLDYIDYNDGMDGLNDGELNSDRFKTKGRLDFSGLDLKDADYHDDLYLDDLFEEDEEEQNKLCEAKIDMDEGIHSGDQNHKPKRLDNNNDSSTDEKGDLQHFLDGNDLSSVILDRNILRSGKLMMTGANYSVCSGIIRTTNKNYPSYAKPIIIQIYKGLNNENDRINMLKNVMRLRQLRHPNILEVIGLCVEGSPVTRDGVEVLMATSRTHFQVTVHRLLSWAKENNADLLTARCVLTFALQICRGCRYLERQRLLHSNLMTSTIMLDSHCIVKLSGIEEHPVSTTHLNTRWLPLETLSDSTFTYKSVVWLFGVVLWELTTFGQQPYPHLTNCDDVYLYLSNGKRLIRPDGCSKQLYHIMYECWHERPRDRPTFDHLMSQLAKYRHFLPPSPTPEELFPDKDDFWEDEYI